jgi:LuxR family maltose regulon positive regulatory protein
LQELEQTTLARVRHAEGRVHDALGVLDALLPSVQQKGRSASVIEVQALRALALWVREEKEKSLEALAEALQIAEPEGYVRQFADCPEPMAALLYEAAARGIGGSYVGKLLAALGGKGAVPRTSGPDEPVIEPLSSRELEVLQLLSEGLSNKQVADRLFVSVATVKWHTSNIYGKLGVSNRTGAVAQARALGVLPLA